MGIDQDDPLLLFGQGFGQGDGHNGATFAALRGRDGDQLAVSPARFGQLARCSLNAARWPLPAARLGELPAR